MKWPVVIVVGLVVSGGLGFTLAADNCLKKIASGDLATTRGSLEEARADYLSALGTAQMLTTVAPFHVEWQRRLSLCLERLGDVATVQNKLDEAKDAYGLSLEIRRKQSAAHPADSEWQRDFSVSLNKVGDVQAAQGHLDDAGRPTGRRSPSRCSWRSPTPPTRAGSEISRSRTTGSQMWRGHRAS